MQIVLPKRILEPTLPLRKRLRPLGVSGIAEYPSLVGLRLDDEHAERRDNDMVDLRGRTVVKGQIDVVQDMVERSIQLAAQGGGMASPNATAQGKATSLGNGTQPASSAERSGGPVGGGQMPGGMPGGVGGPGSNGGGANGSKGFGSLTVNVGFEQ